MELVTPGIGLIFWMLVSFSIVMFLLRKFAWTPILGAIKEREDSIDNALQSAEKARDEMQKIKADNDALLHEARLEGDKIIREARDLGQQYIHEAKENAKIEFDKKLADAQKQIESEKLAAINDIKKQVAELSVDIAEKIMKTKLKSDKSQEELIARLLDDAELN